ncbi:hypothetical protein DFP73DRAFT_178068 [Morchella snyderi]|nr:hypothetical protein DFP73DRAFT_178068 [Morchella snyderi]
MLRTESQELQKVIMEELPLNIVMVRTEAQKLQLIANKIHTYLESGNPKTLYLVTGEPAEHVAELATLLPSVDIRVDIHAPNEDTHSAVVVAQYHVGPSPLGVGVRSIIDTRRNDRQGMQSALANRSVGADDIGMMVLDTGYESEWKIDGDGPEKGILQSVGHQLQAEVFLISRGSALWSDEWDESLETITAEAYKRPILPSSLTPATTPASALPELTPASAIRRLQCLIDTYSRRAAPIFTDSSCEESATVHLPNFLPSHIRTFTGHPHGGYVGPNARQDAACQALLALRSVSLLDWNFDTFFNRGMPSKRRGRRQLLVPDTLDPWDRMRSKPGRRRQLLVPATLDPWRRMRWDYKTSLYRTPIRLRMGRPGEEEEDMVVDMLTSVAVPPVQDIDVHWDSSTRWNVVVGGSECLDADPELV